MLGGQMCWVGESEWTVPCDCLNMMIMADNTVSLACLFLLRSTATGNIFNYTRSIDQTHGFMLCNYQFVTYRNFRFD